MITLVDDVFHIFHFSFYWTWELGWGKEIDLWFQSKVQSFRPPAFNFLFRNIFTVIISKSSNIFFKRFYLFIFTERGREGERERNIDVREIHLLVASRTPPTEDLTCNPRHVPWLGIEPATLQFTDWHSIHWATPARASNVFIYAYSIRTH